MKKITVFLFLLIILTVSLSALNRNLMISWNIGNMGFAGNFPLKGEYAGEFSLSALHFGIESTITNFGFEFNPLICYFWPSSYANNYHRRNDGYLSLLNLKSYWNIINYEGFFAGPFASINYVFLMEDFMWDKFVLTAGFHIGYKIKFNRVYYNIIMGELGYRNINGMSRYHIGAKIDFLALVVCTSGLWWWWD